MQYGSGTSGSITGRTTSAPPIGSAIQGAAAMLASAVKDLSDLAARAEGIADTVFGGGPSSATNGKAEQPSMGTTGALNYELDCLNSVIVHLRMQIDRLSCL